MSEKVMNESEQQGPIMVTIFDQPLRLRSPRGAEHVARVARLVDERMRQVAAHLTTYDVAKIAILAALNLADELQSIRGNYMSAETRAGVLQRSETTSEDTDGSTTSGEEQSWFEAIFDTPAPTRQGNERLSAQVAAKLQALRQTKNEGQDEVDHNDLEEDTVG